jgi:hypothetical protein
MKFIEMRLCWDIWRNYCRTPALDWTSVLCLARAGRLVATGARASVRAASPENFADLHGTPASRALRR